MLEIITGAAGTGKTKEIIKLIEKKVSEGKKCLVVIPDQFSFEYDKKLYKELGIVKFNQLTVLSLSRLARQIFIECGGKKGEYADEITKIGIMYLAIEEAKKDYGFVYYDKQIKSPSFIHDAIMIIKELRWSDISSEELSKKVQFLCGDIMEKTEDISLLYNTYEKVLADRGLKDNLDDNSEAAARAAFNSYFKGYEIFVDEFQSFSKSELKLIEVMIAESNNITFTLTTGGRERLYRIVNDTYNSLTQIATAYGIKVEKKVLSGQKRYKNSDLAYLSRNVYALNKEDKINSENIKIYEAPEVYSEADFVATEIKKLVKDSGYRYSDFAVITGEMDEYGSIFEWVFERYNIPYFLDMQKSIKHKSLLLFIKSLFELSMQEYPQTETVLRYAKTGLTGIENDKILELENYVYQWSIEKKLWTEQFLTDETNEEIEETRKKLINPVVKFKEDITNATSEEICIAIYKFLEKLNVQDKINEEAGSEQEALELKRETVQLFNIVMEILETIYKVVGENKIAVKDFYNIMELMIRESSFAMPPQTIDAVTVAGIERARLAAPKVVFIIGANEGKFPMTVKLTGLLNNRDKEKLKECGLKFEITTNNEIDKSRFLTYTALSAASKKLYITYPLCNISGDIQYPSYVLKKIEDIFVNKVVYRVSELAPQYFCTTEKASYYTFIQGYNVKSSEYMSIRNFLLENEKYRNKISYYDNLRKEEDAKIKDKALVKELFGNKLYVSASRFEDYERCPFMYFCKKGLSIYPLRKYEANVMEKGNVIHSCMQNIFTKYTKDEFTKAEENILRNDIKQSVQKYINESLGGKYAKTERFMSTIENIEDSVLELVKHLQKELLQTDFVPKSFELEISHGSDNKPLHLKTNDGYEIYFSGKVDRVDICTIDSKQYIRVIDYKSGTKKFRLEDIYYGINMQMLLYLFTLTENGGQFNGNELAGVLYMPARDTDKFTGRNNTTEDIEKLKDQNYKMDGLVVDDKKVINAMEKEANGIYIPVKSTKDGFSSISSLITKDQLDNLRSYSKKLLMLMGKNLAEGNIEAVPLTDGKILPCNYCDYIDICGFDATKKVREYSKDTDRELGKILNGGGEDYGKSMDEGAE